MLWFMQDETFDGVSFICFEDRSSLSCSFSVLVSLGPKYFFIGMTRLKFLLISQLSRAARTR